MDGMLLLSRFSRVRLCDPRDSSPPGSPIPGSLQARTLEWVAISFSNAWKWKVKVKLLSRVRLLATPWTAAHQAPPSMGFSRQEHWSGVPLPSPDIPHVQPLFSIPTATNFQILIIPCFYDSNIFVTTSLSSVWPLPMYFVSFFWWCVFLKGFDPLNG